MELLLVAIGYVLVAMLIMLVGAILKIGDGNYYDDVPPRVVFAALWPVSIIGWLVIVLPNDGGVWLRKQYETYQRGKSKF